MGFQTQKKETKDKIKDKLNNLKMYQYNKNLIPKSIAELSRTNKYGKNDHNSTMNEQIYNPVDPSNQKYENS